MKLYQIKQNAQSLYYKMRAEGLDHSSAMSIVVDYVMKLATLPKNGPPAKPAQTEKKKKK